MRLYLSSYLVGDHPERLTALLDGTVRAAVIANSMDDQDDRGIEREFDALGQLGFGTEELDLRDYYAKPDRIASDLARYELVWVRGGNVFVLRKAMEKSGADKAIVDLLSKDAFVYGGYSAGPCVLAPSLQGLELCDDTSAVERVFGEPANFDGLGIIDFAFVPHVDSPGHPETEALGRVAEKYRAEGVPFRALHDGQVLIIEGNDSQLL